MGSIEKGRLGFMNGFIDRLARSWTIIVHSLGLMRRHKVLLLFPFVNVIAFLGIVYFFAVPAIFNVSLGEVWWALWNPGAAIDAAYISSLQADFRPMRSSNPYPTIGFVYLFWVFAATFINVAFYAEILNALNGRGVHMARGFATAGRKVFAILGWSLVAGTVGLAVRAIQNSVGRLGGMIAAFGGIAWGTAGLFVLPIIVRERRQMSPLAYVKISIDLIKRTWGEYAIGLGISFAGAIAITLLIGISVVLALLIAAAAGPVPAILGLLLVVPTLIVAYVYTISIVSNIFNCGLYIYATEGVVPAPFDVELFARSWVVRKRKGGAHGTD